MKVLHLAFGGFVEIRITCLLWSRWESALKKKHMITSRNELYSTYSIQLLNILLLQINDKNMIQLSNHTCMFHVYKLVIKSRWN